MLTNCEHSFLSHPQKFSCLTHPTTQQEKSSLSKRCSKSQIFQTTAHTYLRSPMRFTISQLLTTVPIQVLLRQGITGTEQYRFFRVENCSTQLVGSLGGQSDQKKSYIMDVSLLTQFFTVSIRLARQLWQTLLINLPNLIIMARASVLLRVRETCSPQIVT